MDYQTKFKLEDLALLQGQQRVLGMAWEHFRAGLEGGDYSQAAKSAALGVSRGLSSVDSFLAEVEIELRGENRDED